MIPPESLTRLQTRREVLGKACCGIGSLALSSLLAGQACADSGKPQFQGKARSVIFLFMAGGPSHIETFDPKPLLNRLDGQPRPHDVTALEDLWDGAGLAVNVQGHELALFRVGDEVFATDALCTHGNARLCDGFVEGHEIECPLHQGRFDLRSGAATCAPAFHALKVYPIRIDGGRVHVSFD